MLIDANITLNYGAGIQPERAHRRNGPLISLLSLSLCVRGSYAIWLDGRDNFRRYFTAEQTAGAGYFFTSYVVKHGLSYYQCPWRKRAMVIHFNMMVTEQEMILLKSAHSSVLRSIMMAITESMKRQPLTLPTLAQVMQADQAVTSTAGLNTSHNSSDENTRINRSASNDSELAKSTVSIGAAPFTV